MLPTAAPRLLRDRSLGAFDPQRKATGSVVFRAKASARAASPSLTPVGAKSLLAAFGRPGVVLRNLHAIQGAHAPISRPDRSPAAAAGRQ